MGGLYRPNQTFTIEGLTTNDVGKDFYMYQAPYYTLI